MHLLAVAEANLDLGRVDVHVHLLRRQVQENHRHRVSPRVDQAAVGLAQGVGEEAVAHEPPVDEEVLPVGVCPPGGRPA
jgi:hypothetical protein